MIGWQIKAIFGSIEAAGKDPYSLNCNILGVFEDCEPLGPPSNAAYSFKTWMGNDSWLESNVQIVKRQHMIKNS